MTSAVISSVGEHVQGQRAIFFDIDGTLVLKRSSGSFLAERLGHQVELDLAEAAYAARTLSNHEVCVVDANGWVGRHEHEIETWLADLPLIHGIHETVQWCRSVGLAPYVASLAWSPVGSYLARRFGFLGYCGPQLESVDGTFTGKLASTLDEFGKRDFVFETCRKLGISPSMCAAVGDSRSDLPVFEVVGLSVALNATPAARKAASTRLDTEDLTAIVPVFGMWLRDSNDVAG